MEEFWLGPIVARVEAGVPLSEGELRALEARVAQRPDSLDWLLCLAHALANADQAAAALGLFDRALKLKPGEPLALLGRARALGALERYREAEADLRRILERQPRHADALRALALLRLRSGAPGEARRLVELVLETDPLDDYARQILAEALEAQGGPPAAPGRRSREAFASELQAALTDQGLQSRADAAAETLVVALGAGRRGRLSLASLYEECCADPRGPAAWIEGFVAGLAGVRPPEALGTLEDVRGRIFPALRPRSFLERTGPALHAEGPAGMVWLYALDHPEFVSFLPPDCAARWAVGPAEIERLAFENLERAPRAPTPWRIARDRLEPLPPGSARWDLLAWDAGDGYDASRMLSPAHRRLLEAVDRGPWAVALPLTSCALLARLHDDPALAFLRAFAEAQVATGAGLTADLFRLDGARLDPLAAPRREPP